MTREQELELKERLEARITFDLEPLRTKGCDHTHGITEAFLREKGLHPAYELTLLAERGGGCCDCEILLNADLGGVTA